jgi:hypothetical protein
MNKPLQGFLVGATIGVCCAWGGAQENKQTYQELIAKLDPQLSPPVRVEADGAAIDLSDGIGHAAPFFADFDGDGVKDLLVGQFAEGKLRIYKNIGSNAKPKFDKFSWFMAGGEIGKVPAS